MIKILFILLLFLGTSHAQESPKNIIADEKNGILLQDDNTQDEIKNYKVENNLETFNESNADETFEPVKENVIIIEDLSNNFNQWHGVLSSENGGLGWMMWGNTSYHLSKNLISKISSSTISPTLNRLLKSLLLSRAKAPAIKNQDNDALRVNLYNNEVFPFLENKIGYLVHGGFTDEITNLLNNIPKDLKTDNFEIKNFEVRLNNFDIPYLCNNVSKMLVKKEKLTIYRKILIVCKLILKKEEEAMLAMELLENDILEEDNFLSKIRFFLNSQENQTKKIESIDGTLNLESDQSQLIKMLSFYNYSSAKEAFKDMPRIFHKTIYDLNLFSREIQLESLEYLVNQGSYPPSKLIEGYNSIITEDQLMKFINNEKENTEDNSVLLRASLFKLINSSVSKTERAKNLIKLWDLAMQKNILKAVSLVTKNSTLSLSPDPKLNWFNLSAFKALLLSDEIEAAKKWIFYGTSEVKERASIDINFCKSLIMLYLYDNTAKQSLNETIDIKYLLKTLNNDLNVNEQDLLKLTLTVNALEAEIPEEIWEVFLEKQQVDIVEFDYLRQNVSSYFLLDNAIKKNNLAEAILISFTLLQSEKGTHKDLYSFYKGLNGLYSIGLKKYARDYAIEKNYNFLAR